MNKTYNPGREETIKIITDLAQLRKRKHLTQKEVGARMYTTASAVARFESFGGKKQHSPSLKTVFGYAEAVKGKINFKVEG